MGVPYVGPEPRSHETEDPRMNRLELSWSLEVEVLGARLHVYIHYNSEPLPEIWGWSRL